MSRYLHAWPQRPLRTCQHQSRTSTALPICLLQQTQLQLQNSTVSYIISQPSRGISLCCTTAGRLGVAGTGGRNYLRGTLDRRTLGNCTCNFPSCWLGWDHARPKYLRPWRDKEDSPGTWDLVCRGPFATAQGQGFPGHHPRSSSFSLWVSVTAWPLIQRPTRLGGCRLCLLLLPIGVPGARASSQTTGQPGTVVPCFSSQRPGLASLFLISSVCHPDSPGMRFPSSLDLSLQKPSLFTCAPPLLYSLTHGLRWQSLLAPCCDTSV